MRHIEFMGLPGAGKSVIKDSLLHRAKKRGLRIYCMEEALLYSYEKLNCSPLLTNLFKIFPKFIARRIITPVFRRSKCKFQTQSRFLIEQGEVLRLFMNSKNFGDKSSREKELVVSWFLEVASIYQMVNEQVKVGTPVILDEGFMQISMSLFLSPSNMKRDYDNKDVVDYLDRIPIPDLLVYVETDISECIKRMESRPRGLTQRLRMAEHGRKEMFLSLCQKHFDEIAKWMEINNRAIIRIDNNVLLENTVQRLLEELFIIFDKKKAKK